MAAKVAEYYENDINDQDLALKLIRNQNLLINASGVTEYIDFEGTFGHEKLSEFEAFRHHEFPSELKAQLNKAQSHLSMGLFPVIRRAWITSDSDLYLWRFDTNDDLSYFDAIQDTITNVELVKPQIQYVDPQYHFLLVVVTTAEVLLFGVGFSNAEGVPLARGELVNYHEAQLLIFSQPLFRSILDCGPIQNISGTSNGRIFFSAKDSIYELTYSTGGWFRGAKCDKVNLTKSLISNFIPAISFLTSVEEIQQITIDDTRHFIYSLSDKGTIQVFDLGADGSIFERKKSFTMGDIQREIRGTCGIEDDFLAAIVSIRAIPSTRSHYICLEAITSKGLRIYFTVYDRVFNQFLNDQQGARAETLRVVHVRYPPNEIYGLNRGVTIYCTYGDNESAVFGNMVTAEDSAITIFSSSAFQYSKIFYESFSDFQFTGCIWDFARLPYNTPPPCPTNVVPMLDAPWIVRQHVQTTQQLYVLTSEGIYVFQQLSPVELFRRIITLYDVDSRQFQAFFNWQQHIEICVMALVVLGTQMAQDVQIENTALRILVEFGGIPHIVATQDYDKSFYAPVNQTIANISAINTPLRSSTPFSSPAGKSVANSSIIQPAIRPFHIPENDENHAIAFEQISPSARHDALYTYFSRIVSNIWNAPMCLRNKNGAFNALLMDEVEEVIQYTGGLLVAIEKYNLLTFNRETKILDQQAIRALEQEQQSLTEYHQTVIHTHEFLKLWKILDEHQFHVLTQLLPDDFFSSLGNLTLSTVISRCKEISAEFVTAIVKHYIGDEATTALISQRLGEECPTLFTPQDAHILKASEFIATAKNLPMGYERQKAITNAVDILRNCIRRVNMNLISDLLKQINAYEAIADLALERAAKEDPTKVAVIAYREAITQYEPRIRDAIARRNACYKYIEDNLDYLQDQIATGGSTTISVPLAKAELDAVIQKVLTSDDELAHIFLFNWLLKNNMEDRLLKKQQRFFEAYLCHEIEQGAGERYLQLLWKYYEKNENYAAAANVLLSYAEKSPKINLKSRLTYLSHALLCIQSTAETRPNQELKQKIQEFLDVAQIQQGIYDEVEKNIGVRFAENTAYTALENLNSKLYSLTDLFTEFANKYNLPVIKLAILKCANHYDPDSIEEIWKDILAQAFEAANNDPTIVRARVSEVLSKLMRLYGFSQDFVPLSFILRELLIKAIRINATASWLAVLVKDSDIKFEVALHIIENEFRQDPFWHQPKQLKYIYEFAKYIFDYFVNNYGRMHYTEREVLRDKCLSFIGTMRFYSEENRGDELVTALKLAENQIKER